MREIQDSLRAGDVEPLRKALARSPALAKEPQLVLDASRLANREALILLRESGADLDALWRGYRPLHALLQEHPHAERQPPSEERLACLDWLLANGADPEQLGAWPPARALLIAAFVGEPAFVERLRAAGARTDGFAACALADARAVRGALRSDRAFASARDGGSLTALQCCAASRMGRGAPEAQESLRAIAALLLDAGADPNAPTRSWSHDIDACYCAAGSGNLALFELLLERGADATSALTSAAWSGKPGFVEAALRAGGDPDRAAHEGKPLLNQLVRWGQVKPALDLLARGASPNVADERGWTALHQAASRGNERMLRAILAAGGDAARRDGEGRTPLDVARAMGKTKMIGVLREGPGS